MNAPQIFNATMVPVTSVTTLRDTILASRPPDPSVFAGAPAGWQAELALAAHATEAVHAGQMFVFPPLDLNSDAFHERSLMASTAFAEGLVGLPYEVFVGVSNLVINGEGRLTMVMAEAGDRLIDDGSGGLGPGWQVDAVTPLRPAAGGELMFDRITKLIRFYAANGRLFAGSSSRRPPASKPRWPRSRCRCRW